MLLGGKGSEIKQVAVATRNQQFRQLLSSILAEWKFFSVANLAEARLVFAEYGMDLPDFASEIVWLAPQPLPEGRYLTTPLSLSQLYILLGTAYLPTPRRHIRIAIETQINVGLDNTWQECQMVSIAERGGRFAYRDELQRGTILQLEMQIAGRVLQLPAEVLYSIPAGDQACRSLPQVGVLFRPADDRVISMLRRFIEKTCVESACAREGISLDDACLRQFDFIDDPWREMAG